MLNVVVIAVVIGFVSWALTGLVRRHALSHRILDVPNARSSHAHPTPRGGGVAIVMAFAGAVGWLFATRAAPWVPLAGLMAAALLVAVVGYLDDRSHVPTRLRLVCHAVAAAAMITSLGGIPPFPVFGYMVDMAWFGPILAAVFVVGSLNFFNFMDGIDGIASLQAITVSLGGALCWWLATGNGHWTVPVLLAASTAGFLVWNFPPARIFMGDSGSGFLGMAVAGLALWAGHDHAPLFWSWLTLMGVFIVDPWVTLVRRMRRGARFDEAHRSHAYQYAARLAGSHRTVSMTVVAINVTWLLPIALSIATDRLDGVLGVLVAYAPLVWLAFRLKAGAREMQGALG